MVIFYSILGLFFSFPILWMAVAFHSRTLLLVATLVGVLGVFWFLKNRLSRVTRKLGAHDVDPDSMLAHAWSRAEALASVENSKLELRIYPSPKSESFFWIQSKNDSICFMSQGMASVIDEAGLGRLFQVYFQEDLKKTAKDNSLYALRLWWDELKGRENHFRYWFISFWLYPLERALKIAK